MTTIVEYDGDTAKIRSGAFNLLQGVSILDVPSIIAVLEGQFANTYLEFDLPSCIKVKVTKNSVNCQYTLRATNKYGCSTEFMGSDVVLLFNRFSIEREVIENNTTCIPGCVC